jgi:hypothetical protein
MQNAADKVPAFDTGGRHVVSGLDLENCSPMERAGSVNLYCMASLVADEASREGFADFAKSLEAVLNGFLTSLPREEQGLALRLSYEMALRDSEPAQPRLRLVYSRD